MISRLRVARLDPSGYRPIAEGWAVSAEQYRRLRAVILRHLPPHTAALLTAPQATADGRFIEWYTDLAGEPIPLPQLAPDAQTAARRLLEDRLTSLQALGERLPALEPEEADLAEVLTAALRYPGEASVYVIDGQPVLTFWGFRSASGGPPAGPPQRAAALTTPAAAALAEGSAAAGGAPPGGAAPEEAGPRRTGLGRWWPLALLLLLLGVGLWAWWYYRDLAWPPWVDYRGLIAEARQEGESLAAREQALRAQLAARLERCNLQARLDAARREEPELLRAQIGLQERLTAALRLCSEKKGLAAARQEEQALERRIADLRDQIAKALTKCRAEEAEKRALAAKLKAAEEATKAKPPEPAQPKEKPAPPKEKEKPVPPEPKEPKQPKEAPPPAPKTTQKGLPPCPGERSPQEAPDVAVVLDASGSMRLPASADRDLVMRSLAQQLLGPLGGLVPQTGGPSRLQAAQQAVNRAVRPLPSDVDVGLVVLADCPRASDYGFFSGAQRDRLYGNVNSLRPMQKTPLADGIQRAGNMVDGVKAPAVMVVVSDGEDTCGGNPCAAAAALKARKPLLKINVVDIVGDGKSNCIANATGGRVLKPESGSAFDETIRRATQEAQKPAHCK